MKLFNKTLTTILLSSCVISPIYASEDDYPFIIEQLPQHLEARVAQQQSGLQIRAISGTQDYFISSLKVWNTASPIKVCFFGGSNQLRSRIAQIAMQWTNVGAYIPLDFGDIASPRSCGGGFNHIRIGFQYKGYWSTVGTDSVSIPAQYEQSMNFSLFNVNPPNEPQFTRTVLHEFGHALGFQHAHQSYKAPCVDEFNWELIYSYLKGAPNYWSVKQIDHNLRPKTKADGEASEFNKKSIMLYAFPANFYKTGVNAKCYTSDNNSLSSVDKEGVQKYYPNNLADAQNIRAAGLANFNKQIDLLSISELDKSIAKINAVKLTSPINENISLEARLPSSLGLENLIGTGNRYNQQFNLENIEYLEGSSGRI